jgi:hypothetical protein
VRIRSRLTTAALAALLIGALLLSGCTTVGSSTVVHQDGSGEMRFIVTASRAISALAGESTPVDGITAHLRDVPGGELSPYVDPASGQRGIELVIPFRRLETLGPRELTPTGPPFAVNWTQDGDVNDLEIQIDLYHSNPTNSHTPITVQDREVLAVLAAVSGVQFTYGLALPGQILDWEPKEYVTYDAENNELTWANRITSGPASFKVRWNNVLPAEPIDIPAAAPAPALARSLALDTLQKYTGAVTRHDRAAVTALMAPDGLIINPLAERYPDVFAKGDYRIAYLSADVTDTGGLAEWTGRWQVSGRNYELSGVDIVAFDPRGKILSVQVYVEPTEMLNLVNILP